jgi:hypothetical protein
MNSQRTETLLNPEAGPRKVVEVLLRRLIDYAGLFPPAGLGMLAAVTNYDSYLQSEKSWMLGRLIVPAARLREFGEVLVPVSSSKPWGLSALVGADPAVDVARVAEFNAGVSDRGAVVEALEMKAEHPESIARLSAVIPREFTVYFEIPLAGCEDECITAVAECGRRAKIRTGGETADKIPDSFSVVEFMRLCMQARVPFKATAGLHHPIRSVHRLTYQAESPSGLMHGFLNVFLAAAFLRAGMETRVAVELLEEQSAAAMRFEAEGVGWREYEVGWPEVAATRLDFAISFGSCSFTEPVEDLRMLGLI